MSSLRNCSLADGEAAHGGHAGAVQILRVIATHELDLGAVAAEQGFRHDCNRLLTTRITSITVFAMATITFDTLKFVTRLKDSGLSEKQAVAITEAFREAHSDAEVATRRDVEELRLEMKNVEARLEGKLAETKSELIRWVVGAGFLQTALIAALLLKLIK